MTVGDKVIKSGYNGTITKVHSGMLQGMVDVAMKRADGTVSGVVTVALAELD